MGYIFFDESKHPRRGFNLGAFVYCAEDLSERIQDALLKNGLRPNLDEFKSSFRMDTHSGYQAVRDELQRIIQEFCRIAIVVTSKDDKIGAEAFHLLSKMLQHTDLVGIQHEV